MKKMMRNCLELKLSEIKSPKDIFESDSNEDELDARNSMYTKRVD